MSVPCSQPSSRPEPDEERRERIAAAAESNRRLLDLNRAIVAGQIEYHPFD